jgi:hypothetical protein
MHWGSNAVDAPLSTMLIILASSSSLCRILRWHCYELSVAKMSFVCCQVWPKMSVKSYSSPSTSAYLIFFHLSYNQLVSLLILRTVSMLATFWRLFGRTSRLRGLHKLREQVVFRALRRPRKSHSPSSRCSFLLVYTYFFFATPYESCRVVLYKLH